MSEGQTSQEFNPTPELTLPVDIKLYFTDSALHLKDKIIPISIVTIQKVKKLLPFNAVKILFSEDEEHQRFVIPQIGIGGVAWDGNTTLISVSNNPDSIASAINYLPETLSHEAHHNIRFRSYGLNRTLSDAVIAEGLADHFSQEITGSSRPPLWARALSQQDYEKYRNLLQLSIASGDVYNREVHGAWFYGKNTLRQNIPKWTGYSIGYKIVDDYLVKHSNLNASTLYSFPTHKFFV